MNWEAAVASKAVWLVAVAIGAAIAPALLPFTKSRMELARCLSRRCRHPHCGATRLDCCNCAGLRGEHPVDAVVLLRADRHEHRAMAARGRAVETGAAAHHRVNRGLPSPLPRPHDSSSKSRRVTAVDRLRQGYGESTKASATVERPAASTSTRRTRARCCPMLALEQRESLASVRSSGMPCAGDSTRFSNESRRRARAALRPPATCFRQTREWRSRALMLRQPQWRVTRGASVRIPTRRPVIERDFRRASSDVEWPKARNASVTR